MSCWVHDSCLSRRQCCQLKCKALSSCVGKFVLLQIASAVSRSIGGRLENSLQYDTVVSSAFVLCRHDMLCTGHAHEPLPFSIAAESKTRLWLRAPAKMVCNRPKYLSKYLSTSIYKTHILPFVAPNVRCVFYYFWMNIDSVLLRSVKQTQAWPNGHRNEFL